MNESCPYVGNLIAPPVGGSNAGGDAQLDILYNRSPTTGEEWCFRKYYYNKIPSYCMTNIAFKKNNPDEMVHVGCNRLSCPRCRPKLKPKIMERLVETCQNYGLFRMLVITCPGKEWRSVHGPDYSFKWMNKKWDSFKVLYQRETGKKLNYIKLPRSQKDGYCHPHILLDQYIPQSLIEDILKRVGLGKIYKIKHMDLHRLGVYLRNDFFKDHEWYIPVGMHHISSSMEVLDEGYRRSIFIMWLPGPGDYAMVVFGRRIPPHKRYDFVYDVVQNFADRPPPLWFFNECFSEMLHLSDNDNYVVDIKKQYLPPTANSEGPAAYCYQLEVNGRLHRITREFSPPKYTNQKKFKKGGVSKHGRYVS